MADSDDIQPIICDTGTGMVKVSIRILLLLFLVIDFNCIIDSEFKSGRNTCLMQRNDFFLSYATNYCFGPQMQIVSFYYQHYAISTVKGKKHFFLYGGKFFA